MLKNIFGFIAIAILTGCAASVVSSTPGSVMLTNVSSYNMGAALQLAEAECQKYGRHAVHIPDNQRDYNVSYECKD